MNETSTSDTDTIDSCPMSSQPPVLQPAVVDDIYNPVFFEQLAELERGHYWFEPRNRLITLLLGRHFPSANAMLEVGCGTGFVLQAIRQAYPSWHLTGSDFFEEGLQFCRARVKDVDLIQMDARKMPFNNEFDVIGAFDMLEHVDEDACVLRQFRQALRPGGGLLLTVPQHPCLWSSSDEVAHHKRRYTRRRMRNLLKETGFRPEHMTSFVSVLLPAMLVSRWLSRMRRSKTVRDPLGDLRVSPTLNRCLRWILEREVDLTTLGISVPFGGSLVVVARRAD